MYYSQFSKKLNATLTGMDIHECIHFYGSVIQRSNDTILIDNAKTDYATITEAKDHIRYAVQVESIVDTFRTEVYRDNVHKIADIINEEHDIKVTNNVIDSYIDLALSNQFTIDSAVHRIRQLNNIDTIVEGKIHYTLNDNSVVAIEPETQEIINNTINNNLDAVEYMKESSDNFLKILSAILQEQ